MEGIREAEGCWACLFIFQGKKAGAESGCQSYLEMCAAQSSQKRRDEKISRNSVCLSRLVKLRERLCCSPAVKCPYGCFNVCQCVPSSFWTPLSSIVLLAAVLQAGSSGGVGFVWFFFYVKLKLSVKMFLNQQRRKYFLLHYIILTQTHAYREEIVPQQTSSYCVWIFTVDRERTQGQAAMTFRFKVPH